MNKYKKPVKNKVKTLLQGNPLLNETDLYETDDPVIKRIPHQHSQSSQELHTLFTEIQHHYFNDINLSQVILTNFTNFPPIVNNIENNARTQTSPKPIQAQSLPFFGPSFFAHRKAFDNFFLPSDTFLTVPILLQAQKDDPVLSTVYKWLKQQHQRPHSLTPVIKANSFLYTYYRHFQHLYIDPSSHLIQNYTPNSRDFEEIFIRLNLLLTKHVYVFHLNFFCCIW